MSPPARIRSSLRTSTDWRQYATGEISGGGVDISLQAPNGRLPAAIMMTEEGDFISKTATGVTRTLSDLPAWIELKIQPQYVDSTQSAGFIVFW